jgi:CP family cyanate transporter-like MFS transporter
MIINVLVVILISSNLRSPIVAVAPVLGEVREALNLDNFQVSLLTSIPLFMFAACSVLVSRFSNTFGISKLLMYSVIILSFGLFLRFQDRSGCYFWDLYSLGWGYVLEMW